MKKSVTLLTGALICLACKNPTTSHPRAIVSDDSISTSQAVQNGDQSPQTTGQQVGQAPQGAQPDQGAQGAPLPGQAQRAGPGAAPVAVQSGAAKNQNGQNPGAQPVPQSGAADQNRAAAGGGCPTGYAPVPSTTVLLPITPDCWSAPKDGTRVGYYAKGTLLCMRQGSVQPVQTWHGTWHVIEVQVMLKGHSAPTQCWTECKYTSNRAVSCGICEECV